MIENIIYIIAIAVVAGIVLLLLKERVSTLTTFVDHMNVALGFLMAGASALIPFMVFLACSRLRQAANFRWYSNHGRFL
jgi:Na+/H+-dicarboxylate symporter